MLFSIKQLSLFADKCSRR